MRFSRSLRYSLSLIFAASCLTACDTLREYWPGEKSESATTREGVEYRPERAGEESAQKAEDSAKAAGKPDEPKKTESYEVMAVEMRIKPDASLDSMSVLLPEAIANDAWPQRGASASNAVGQLVLGKVDREDSATIGDGNDWNSVLVTAPVVSGGTVYAMDAKGYVSAHDAKDIDDEKWTSEVPVVDDKDIMGGGLAVGGDYLFASTGQGDVFAMSTKDGSKIWKRNLGVPVRSAPKIFRGLVYITTIDDQLFALNAVSGQVTWQHRGLGERVGFLTAISPAINENLVVVAYGSGEIYGLAADTGQEVWNDSLAQTQKTTATASFTGFSADPVIAGGMAITASAGGMTAATHLISGQRIWDKQVSGGGTPWVAGNFIFQLTNDAQVVAFNADDGRIKWVSGLPRFEEKKKQLDPYTYYGPLLVGGELLVFGSQGKMFALSPTDGKQLRREDFSDKLGSLPIVAGGVMYYVTRDAKLHAVKE